MKRPLRKLEKEILNIRKKLKFLYELYLQKEKELKQIRSIKTKEIIEKNKLSHSDLTELTKIIAEIYNSLDKKGQPTNDTYTQYDKFNEFCKKYNLNEGEMIKLFTPNKIVKFDDLGELIVSHNLDEYLDKC